MDEIKLSRDVAVEIRAFLIYIATMHTGETEIVNTAIHYSELLDSET